MIPMKKARLDRRTFLRAGATTAIALPALEAMFDSDGAFAQDGKGKTRFCVIYQPNGHAANRFAPNGTRGSLDFEGRSTAPLAPYADQLTFLKNMVGPHGLRGRTPNASQGNSHMVAITSFLTGKPIASDREQTNTITADRLIGDYYEEHVPLGKSQVAAISGSAHHDPPNPGTKYFNDQKEWLSTDRNGQRIIATINLEHAKNEIFEGVDATASAEQRAREAALNQSILDVVLDEERRLRTTLGAADRRVVENYMDNIRDLEQRLSSRPSESLGCAADAKFEWSRDWPVERRNRFDNDYIDDHWRDTSRLLQVAFQCEAIRSVSYMLETEAGASGYANAGLRNSHAASHSGNADYAGRDLLHSEVFAEMLELFKSTPVGGDGTLLDNTLLVWGAGIGVNHSHDDQMTVLAGYNADGGIRHGTVRNFNNDPETGSATPLMRTLMTHMGVMQPTDTFGDSGPGTNFPDLMDLGS